MTNTPCQCCGLTVRVPELPADTLACCPECGQVVQLPPGWACVPIPNADPRLLVLAPPDVGCTLKSSGQLDPDTESLAFNRLGVGVAAVGLLSSAAFLFPWGDPQITPFFAQCGVAIFGCLLVICAGTVRRLTALRRGEIAAYRWAVPVSLTAPTVGVPYLLQPTRRTVNFGLIGFGLAFIRFGCYCLDLVLRGVPLPDQRMLAMAFVAPPMGVIMTVWGWMCLRYRSVITTDGFAVVRGQAVQFYRWDEIGAVSLHRGTSVDLEGFSGRLTLANGETVKPSALTNSFDGKFTRRAIHETTARRLRDCLRALARGETLDFGPVRLGFEGAEAGDRSIPWAERPELGFSGQALLLRAEGVGGRMWQGQVQDVPDVGLLWAVLEARKTASE